MKEEIVYKVEYSIKGINDGTYSKTMNDLAEIQNIKYLDEIICITKYEKDENNMYSVVSQMC